jgi:hypothetical protein
LNWESLCLFQELLLPLSSLSWLLFLPRRSKVDVLRMDKRDVVDPQHFLTL